MKLCYFDDHRFGLVDGAIVRDVTDILNRLPYFRPPLPSYDPVIAALSELKPLIEEAAPSAATKPVTEVKMLSPVGTPGKIIAAPVNYRAHLDEAIAEPQTFSAAHVRPIQESGLFLKATSSVIGTSQDVRLKFPERRNDHEIELALVIGRTCSDVSEEAALDYVAGYTLGLDITLRGPEERSFRKSIDTYTVLGPWLVTTDEFGDPSDVGIALSVNGVRRQQARTRNLIMSVRQLVSFASRFYTLRPGDVIMTGTPEGVGPIVAGDLITAEVERVGLVEVRVR